jgi:2-C-methyl-D-erythritol 4-phosphate cytidylyltransferase
LQEKEQKADCCAVIVAAGTSSRMGFSKQEVPVLGIPALEYCLSAFEKVPRVGAIVVVCPIGKQKFYEKWLLPKFHKPLFIIQGGSTRQQSAQKGVEASPDYPLVAVHDGARILITPQEIEHVISDAEKYGASALAMPVKDTIKMVDEKGFVLKTPQRDTLWAVQTPQVFGRKQYLELLKKADGDDTDDCQLFEKAGEKVHLCRGNYTNFKLTTPEDLEFAEVILKKREENR